MRGPQLAPITLGCWAKPFLRTLFLLAGLLATGTAASAQGHGFRLERMIGTPVDFPQDIQVSTTGVLHVLDRGGVVKLDATGRYQQTIPLRSATRSPEYQALAVDKPGNIFVLNRTQSFVRQYSAGGDSLRQLGGAGAAPGQFLQPEGIAVDADGNLYVADTGNNRLQKLTASGQVQWVYAPTGAQALVQPADVELAPDGSVYVLNKNYSAVQLSATGQLLRTISLGFPGSSPFDKTLGLDLDAAGTLYVVTSQLATIQRYTAQGEHLGAFGTSRGPFTSHPALALDGTGNVYVLDASDREQSISAIRKLSPTGALLSKWGNDAVFGYRMRQDEAGNLYYTHQKEERIVKMSPAGEQLATFGEPGQGQGQFNGLTSLAVDLQGYVYGLEGRSFPPRVQKFDPQGRWISQTQLPNPLPNPNGYWPTDLAVDVGGNLYVLDWYSGVRKYSAQGQLLQQIGAGGNPSGPGPGTFYAPRGVVLDSRGNIYVSDGAGQRIQKFSPSGQVVREFISAFPPAFVGSPSLSPWDAGLAVDGAGNVYTSIGRNNYITLFEGQGTRQVKLVVDTNPSILTINQRGTRLTCATWGHDVLRFFVPTTSVPENLISGQVFQDLNNDCVQQATEPTLPNIVVRAEPGSFYGLTDANGTYSVAVDTGAYMVQQLLPPSQPGRVVQQRCAGSAAVSFGSYGNAVRGPDFGNQVSLAPHLTVSVASNRRRRCFRNVTTVAYSNTGFAPSAPAQVVVALPEHVLFLAADVPHTRDGKGNYVFAVGTLAPNAHGTITIQDSVSCGDPSIRGLTVCTTAWITPANTYPTPPNWNAASLTVSGTAQPNNQARFTLTNTGKGATTDSLTLRVYQDTELALQQRYSLAASDSLVLRVPATGRVVRVETDQPTGHPLKTQASATVELAARVTDGVPSPAMMAYPLDDREPEKAQDCQPILDSFDPNDKQVTPQGVTEQHYTPTNTPLRYQLRFQNTGNDVAYRVEVVDTLAAELDLSTLQGGAASHPYRLSVSGKARPVLTFTFDNILLPDSTSNEPGSHGFVQFSVQPQAGLVPKARIDNFADIYFDYNEPVRTNSTVNRIYDVPPTIEPARQLVSANVLVSPSIASFTPAQGRVGTLVTLTGTHILAPAGTTRVRFQGVEAPVLSATATTLTVRVPVGATSGPLQVVTAEGARSSATAFTVYQSPTITALSATEGVPGDLITITGTHFSSVAAQDTVTLNGLPARVVQASATSLQVEVPTGAEIGRLVLQTLGGQVASAQPFRIWYPPTVTTLSPGKGGAGHIVTLLGTRFAQPAARNRVRFADALGEVLSASASQLRVRVPLLAQSGPVQVQTPGGSATAPTPFVFLPAPVVSSFSPQEGSPGTEVTLLGQHFLLEGGPDTVFFQGVRALVLRASATELVVEVPKGATSGALTVAGAGGRGQALMPFVVPRLSPLEAIALYPNPTTGAVTVSWRAADFAVHQVQVVDAVGRCVLSRNVQALPTETLTLELGGQRAGLYLVVVQTAQGTLTKRLTLL